MSLSPFEYWIRNVHHLPLLVRDIVNRFIIVQCEKQPSPLQCAVVGPKLWLRQFALSQIKLDHYTVVIGQRGSGKGTLVRDIIYHKRDDIPTGHVIDPCDEITHEYRGIVPRLFIHQELTPAFLQYFFARQRRNNIESRSRAFLVLDSCPNSEIIDGTRELILNGRHNRITTIQTMDYPHPYYSRVELRNNVHYVFAFKTDPRSMPKLWQNYFGMFPTYKLFCTVLDACTQNFDCLVVDRTVKSSRWQDCVFWYKAQKLHPRFRMGSQSYWAANNMDG